MTVSFRGFLWWDVEFQKITGPGFAHPLILFRLKEKDKTPFFKLVDSISFLGGEGTWKIRVKYQLSLD